MKTLRHCTSIALLLTLAVGCTAPAATAPATSAPPTPESRSAQLSEPKATVEAQENENAEWQAALTGQTILSGGGARTGDESRARLDISDGTIVRLAANTDFKLVELSPTFADPVTRLRLDAGKVWVSVTSALGLGAFDVETPVGLAGVRGSLMSVEYDPATGVMIVTCLEGLCRLSGASGSFTDLTAGQQSEIGGPGLDPTPAHLMDSTQLADWSRESPEAQAAVATVITATPTLLPAVEPTLTSNEAPVISSTDLPGAPDFVRNMRLAFDGQGTLHLAYVSSVDHHQLNPDGTWTEPQSIAADFGALNELTLLPDSTGRMCIYWNGEYQGTPNYIRGLFRSCQNDDGTWPVVQEPLVTPPAASGFADVLSLSPAPDGRLSAVYVTFVGQIATLFFAQIDPEAGPVELTGTQLSGDTDVKKAQLAIDFSGNYHVAWVESSDGIAFTVQYRYSEDAGQTWTDAIELYSGFAEIVDYLGFQLVADRIGQVHLAWDASPIIFYSRWTPAGGWEERAEIPQGEIGSGVRLAVTNRGLARALWNGESGVWYGEQSSDGTWKAQVVTGYANDMALAVDNDGLSHLVWNGDNGLSYATIREVPQASGPSEVSATRTPRPTPPPPTPPFGGQGPADIPGFGTPQDELVSADQDSLIYLIPAGYFEKVPLVYQDLMPQYNWTLTPEGAVSQGGKVTMQFTKENRTATIVIAQEPDGRTRVAVEITMP